MSILDWFRRPSPPALPVQTDAEVLASPLVRQHVADSLSALMGAIGSGYSGAGGENDPITSTRPQPPDLLTDHELAWLAADALSMRICSEPSAWLASAGHRVETADGADVLGDLARPLGIDAAFGTALTLARWLRGAGVLMVTDDDRPLCEPLPPGARILRLVVYGGLVLRPVAWQSDHAEPGLPALHARHVQPGAPRLYQLTPSPRTGGYSERIHWTRVLPFQGAPIPPDVDGLLPGLTDWRSLSVLDRCWPAIRRYWSTARNGERIAGATGIFVTKVPNFAAIQAGPLSGGSEGSAGWVPRMWAGVQRTGVAVGPPGLELDATSVALGGWADLEASAATGLAAMSSIPVPLLFSTPPPGFSTDEKSWWNQWIGFLRALWTMHLSEPYARLYELLHVQATGAPPAWLDIRPGPWREPTDEERMALRVQGATEAATLQGAGIDVSAAVLAGRYGADGWAVELPPVENPPSSRAPAALPTQADAAEGVLVALEVDPFGVELMRQDLAATVPGFQPELWPHLTLVYLGNLPARDLAAVERIVADHRAGWPTSLTPTEIGPLGDQGALVAHVRRGGLEGRQSRLLRALAPYVRADQYPRFLPHVTLGYGRLAEDQAAPEPITAPLRAFTLVLRVGGAVRASWAL